MTDKEIKETIEEERPDVFEDEKEEKENPKLSVLEKLSRIQTEIIAPKNLYNKFSNFYYRDMSSIMEGLKPLLEKYKAVIHIEDELIFLEGRFYIMATATLLCSETGEGISAKAYAREQDSRPKFDDSQVTGSSSTYARKYALNGLLALDDSEGDPDHLYQTNNNQQPKQSKAQPKQTNTQPKANNQPKPQQNNQLQGKINQIDKLARELVSEHKEEVMSTIEKYHGTNNYLTIEDESIADNIINDLNAVAHS